MSGAFKRPWAVLGALAVLAGLSVWAATTLRIDADSSRMLDPDLPAQKQAHALNAAFPTLKSSIVIAITADQADAADLAAQDLVTRLKGQDAIGDVFAPAVDAYMTAHGFLYRDRKAVADSFTRLSKSANLLARLRSDRSLNGFLASLEEALLLAERSEIGPDALERLFAETAATLEAQVAQRPYVFGWSTMLDDGDSGPATRLISVQPVLDRTRLNPAKPALLAIQAAIADLPDALAEPVEIGVTGEPALRAEETASVTGSIGLSLALSMVLVALILRVGLRAGGPVLLSLAALVVSLVLTTGLAAVTVSALNLISVAFIVLMVGLGIDFAIHILAHINEQREHGSTPRDAVRLTGQRTGLALGLSAVTTALAFLAFTITEFRGMAQLGLIGAPGVLIAFVVAATMIPAMMAVMPGMAGRVRPHRPTPGGAGCDAALGARCGGGPGGHCPLACAVGAVRCRSDGAAQSRCAFGPDLPHAGQDARDHALSRQRPGQERRRGRPHRHRRRGHRRRWRRSELRRSGARAAGRKTDAFGSGRALDRACDRRAADRFAGRSGRGKGRPAGRAVGPAAGYRGHEPSASIARWRTIAPSAPRRPTRRWRRGCSRRFR